MEKFSEEIISDNFLKEGEQTKINPEITEIVKSIEGDGLGFVTNALHWVKQNIRDELPEGVEKNDIFRKRTAADIINNGYASGCTDFALAFIVLTRAKGIPTKYVEAISEDYLKDKDPNQIRGHIFAECYLDNQWVGVDPMRGKVLFNTNYPGYVVYSKGLDSWDLGIKDMRSIQEKFKSFTEEYNAGNRPEVV